MLLRMRRKTHVSPLNIAWGGPWVLDVEPAFLEALPTHAKTHLDVILLAPWMASHNLMFHQFLPIPGVYVGWSGTLESFAASTSHPKHRRCAAKTSKGYLCLGPRLRFQHVCCVLRRFCPGESVFRLPRRGASPFGGLRSKWGQGGNISIIAGR
jgi:hypothetical protein